MFKLYVLLFFIAFQTFSFAQGELKTNFKKHIEYLASDELEGRMTGKKGEKLAATYIQAEMKGLGATPEFEGSYLQKFHFTSEVNPLMTSNMIVNGRDLMAGEDFFPYPKSGSNEVRGKGIFVGYGILDTLNKRNDYKGKRIYDQNVFIMDASHPGGYSAHGKFAFSGSIDEKVKTAMKMGASAVIMYTIDETYIGPSGEYGPVNKRYDIPVVFMPLKHVNLIHDQPSYEVHMTIDMNETVSVGMNVGARLDFGAEKTIIIGGHYDHLGFGHHGSLHRGAKAIHNGADDNASGIAMMIELARTIQSNKKYQKFNYLFLFFSGEELGLLGSGHYVNHPTVKWDNVHAMINFDMIGRLDTTNRLIITGTGTAKAWNRILKRSKVKPLSLKLDPSGIGPSDHTKFYIKSVPVLHFFTGPHAQYHKPTDDADLINYQGMEWIHAMVLNTIKKSHCTTKKGMAFRETKNPDMGGPSKFNVTLGIIPDYGYAQQGLRIDGITTGKVADVAGLLSGDVIIQMGSLTIDDIQDYMKALSIFHPGDEVIVKVKRGKEIIEKVVVF